MLLDERAHRFTEELTAWEASLALLSGPQAPPGSGRAAQERQTSGSGAADVLSSQRKGPGMPHQTSCPLPGEWLLCTEETCFLEGGIYEAMRLLILHDGLLASIRNAASLAGAFTEHFGHARQCAVY